jgi:hypothetical protein
MEGKKVVLIAPYGFIYIGIFHEEKGYGCRLDEAFNIRYWAARPHGLPQLAQEGVINDDKIDAVSTVYLSNYIALYPALYG